jgi:hypothetical protein
MMMIAAALCLQATRYLNMDHLKEHKKEALRALAA